MEIGSLNLITGSELVVLRQRCRLERNSFRCCPRFPPYARLDQAVKRSPLDQAASTAATGAFNRAADKHFITNVLVDQRAAKAAVAGRGSDGKPNWWD